MKFKFKRGSATKKGAIYKRAFLSPDHSLYPYFYNSKGKPLKVEEVREKFEKAPDEIKKMAIDRGIVFSKEDAKK